MIRKTFLICCLIVNSFLCFSQINLEWAVSAVDNTSTPEAVQSSRCVIEDNSGNLFVFGYFQGTVDFDPSEATAFLTSNGGYDVFIAKYDNSGNYIFVKRIGGTLDDVSIHGVHDSDGNIYFTGSFQGTVDFDAGTGVNSITSLGSNDIFFAKYDNSGNYIFAKTIGGTSDDIAAAVALDSDNNIYVGGRFLGTSDFDPSGSVVNLSSSGGTDVFFAKYDNSGNYMFVKKIDGNSNDYFNGFVLDASNNLYITGRFEGTADFSPGAGTANLYSYGYADVYLAKYDVSGNYIYAKQIGGEGNDLATAISIDASSNIYISGGFNSTADFNPGAGTSNLTPSGDMDIFFAKYDASGNYIYAKSIGGYSEDYTYSNFVNAENEIYITGFFKGTADFDPGAAVVNLTSSGDKDIYIAKYDENGNYVFAKKMGGSLIDFAYSIILDSNYNIYITGAFQGTADFDPSDDVSNLQSINSYDTFLAKYRQLPEMEVYGNDILIENGATTTSEDNYTHFGNTGSQTFVNKTFTIYNSGNNVLTFTDNPRVTVSGSDFSLVTDAPETIETGASATFEVKYFPTSNCGISNGSIVINSDDFNSSSYIFAISGYADNDAPVAPVLTDLTASCSITPEIPVANDFCEGQISGYCLEDFPVTTSKQIVWLFIDESGNFSIAEQNIIITEENNPPAVPSLDDIVAECYVTPEIPVTTDVCDGEIYGTCPEAFPVDVSKTITWTFTDSHGNFSTADQNIVITDDATPPVVPELPDITGQCAVNVTSSPIASDYCTGDVTGTTSDELTYTEQGSYIIEWTFTDSNGFSTVANQTIIVDDNTGPVPSVASLPDVTGECSAEVTTVPTALDNCSGFTTGSTTDALEYSVPGTYVVEWTYTDIYENTTIQPQNVIVSDNDLPAIECVEDFSMQLLEGENSYTAIGNQFDIVSASDNCGILDTINDFNSLSTLEGAVFPVGETTVTWSLTDVGGNISECSFIVNVIEFVNINGLNNSEINLYPNPSRGTFSISSVNEKIETVIITDLAGKEVFYSEINKMNASIDLTKLSNGVYLIKIYSGSEVYFDKIVKE